MLYLGSDKHIPLILWSEKNPNVAFNNPVTKPKHFSKKNVYYVNSTECCGCGFRQKNDVLHPDFTEIEEKNKNQRQLYEHLSSFLSDENDIELFGCWAGSENDVTEKREINVSELLKEDFYFAENELVKVRK